MEEGKSKSRTMHADATAQEQVRMQKEYYKKQAVEMAAYKKQLTEAISLKRLQVEELELNNEFYVQKTLWLKNQPLLEVIETQEQEMIKKKEEDRQALIAEKEIAARPDIIIPNAETAVKPTSAVPEAKTGEKEAGMKIVK